jgi:hypothetical protein
MHSTSGQGDKRSAQQRAEGERVTRVRQAAGHRARRHGLTTGLQRPAPGGLIVFGRLQPED